MGMPIDFTKKGLIVYITAGYPDMEFTLDAILALQSCGVSAIELGIPYSDPVADGPVIAMASMLSLQRGTNLDKIFQALSAIKNDIRIPVYLMSYFSPLYTYGIDKMIDKSKDAGIEGVVFPDLTIEEGGQVFSELKKNSLDPILLAFPNSGEERIRRIAANSGSFVYYVNLFGTTGVRDRIPEDSLAKLASVKSIAGKPVYAGFGISTREMFLKLCEHADGGIVGSAVMKRILDKADDRKQALNDAAVFVNGLLGK
jgi:tryptophan synthase alpha chain